MATIFIDGSWTDEQEAKISVYDHGLLYGDGLFEGIRIYNGKIFKLEEHLRRLFEGAKAIMLTIPHTENELADILITGASKLVEEQAGGDGYIRLIVTRGVGDLGLDPRKCARPSVIAIIDSIELYPQELYESGIPIITASSRRVESSVFDPRIKSLNYLNNILAKQEAILAGCLEAVMLNHDGYLTECTGDNIFLVKDGTLKTPASHLGILEGITRNTILELARENGIPAEETMLTRFDLYTADECFLSGSGAEMMPVTSVDGRTVGGQKTGGGKPGPITERLLEAFRAFIAVQCG